ncbi:potassium voltage-gated channel protein Shaker-like [Dendronephthya gigantea]|uniref:potassium voltage-gated channel protein Shaker-like n=1 Tax=Dendronephthya gigantea TaxID=151771 RepID=UPI00106A21D2|nr:potassium voltage-gated channel protein Shaker-like [Dendronephthya gigantea]
MSSSVAGSAAVTMLDIQQNRSNISLSSGNPHRFASVASFEIIHRSTMPNNNDTEPHLGHDSQKVVINVRGTIFETYETTLLKYPDTLLGSSDKRAPYYNTRKKQYCFKCDREAFDAILYYYQSSGKLIRPKDVNEDIFLAELEFFQIDPYNVADLEYGPSNFRIPKKRQGNQEEEILESGYGKISTFYDAFLSWPCGLIVILYMLTLCLSSAGQYQMMLPRSCSDVFTNNTSLQSKRKTTQLLDANDHPLVVLHYICSVWFLLEFILRFLISELKVKYIRSVLGFIDIITILSMFSQILLRQFDACQLRFLMWLINVMRTLSILCMFKLSRYSTGLRLFGLTVKACSGQLILSFYCVGICLLFFSSVIYYSEESVNLDFTSILDAFWYTIVTLTTVGYGDITPVSLIGKTFGAICSVFGVTIVMAWPATIFVSHFKEMYNHEMGQKRKKERKFWSNKIFKFRKGLMRLDATGCTFRK